MHCLHSLTSIFPLDFTSIAVVSVVCQRDLRRAGGDGNLEDDEDD